MTLLLAFTPNVTALPVVGPMAAALGAGLSAGARGLGFEVSANPALATMLTLAFANGWFQACGWPPCVKVAGHWFPPRQRGRMMGILGTSYTVGSAIAITCVGALLHAAHGAWAIAFAVPAAVLALSFVQMAWRLKERPSPAAGASIAPRRRIGCRFASRSA